MTTEQETQHIHNVLPLLEQNSYGYSLFDEYQDKHKLTDNETILLGTRLLNEGLVTENKDAYYYLITSKGAEIAREPGGYLGRLAHIREQQRGEARRSWLSAHGTWIGGIATLLTLAYTIYSTQANADSVEQLSQRLQIQAKRLQALEAALQPRQHSQGQQPDNKPSQGASHPAR